MSGLTLLVVSIWLLTESGYYLHYMEDTFCLLFGLMIVTAIVIFITALIGCYGVKKEKYNFVVAYITLLVTILIIELSISGLGYWLQYNAEGGNAVLGKLYDDIQDFVERGNSGVWDSMQRKLHCCGYRGIKDFGADPWRKIPLSCCPIPTVSPFQCSNTNAYYNGCSNVLRSIFSYYAYVIGVTAASVAGVQGLIILLAVGLAYRLKSQQDLLHRNLMEPAPQTSRSTYSRYHIIPGQNTWVPTSDDPS